MVKASHLSTHVKETLNDEKNVGTPIIDSSIKSMESTAWKPGSYSFMSDVISFFMSLSSHQIYKKLLSSVFLKLEKRKTGGILGAGTTHVNARGHIHRQKKSKKLYPS